MIKKVLSLMLALLLVVACITVPVHAEDSEYEYYMDPYSMFEAAAWTSMVEGNVAPGETPSFGFIFNYLNNSSAFGEYTEEHEDEMGNTWGSWKFTLEEFMALVDRAFMSYDADEIKAGLLEYGIYDEETDVVSIEEFGGFGGAFEWHCEDYYFEDDDTFFASGMMLEYDINYDLEESETVESKLEGMVEGYDYFVFEEEGETTYATVTDRSRLTGKIDEDGYYKFVSFDSVDYHIFNGTIYQMTDEDTAPLRQVFSYLDEGVEIEMVTEAVDVPMYGEGVEIWYPVDEVKFKFALEDGFTLRKYEIWCSSESFDIEPDEDGVFTVPAGNEAFYVDAYTDRVIVDSKDTFEDIEDKWYKEYVDYAVTYELFNGVSENEFAPNESMTRGMFITVLYRMTGENYEADPESIFKDVDESRYYAPAIAWALENKITNGVSENSFGVNEKITREQVCTLLSRFAKEWAWVEIGGTIEKTEFADDKDISSWAKDAVYACQVSGIVNGVTETEFEPKGTATRAQVAKILSVFHKQYIAW